MTADAGSQSVQHVDLHSHLIPGVDDGARTVEDSLEGLGRMVERGIVRLATTPHVKASLGADPRAFDRHMEELDGAWRALREAVATRWPRIDLQRGAEVKLDIPRPDLGDSRLRLGGTRFILVEWPRMSVPPHTPEVLEALVEEGLVPVLAHPERYHGLDSELEVVGRWRRSGALLQVNYGSLLGRYGPGPRAVAWRLLRRGWIDYLSTDFHGRPHLPLFHDRAVQTLREMGGEEQVELLCDVNPARLLDDEDPLRVPALQGGRGLWSRFRERVRGYSRDA